jgi:hypothetical protein
MCNHVGASPSPAIFNDAVCVQLLHQPNHFLLRGTERSEPSCCLRFQVALGSTYQSAETKIPRVNSQTERTTPEMRVGSLDLLRNLRNPIESLYQSKKRLIVVHELTRPVSHFICRTSTVKLFEAASRRASLKARSTLCL